MFSKACEYGIKAAIFIAVKSQKEERVSLQEIAKSIDSPIAFTAKILQKLAHHQIVQSNKGPHGGFIISLDDMRRIKLSEIVTAIDGNKVYEGCGLGFKSCNEKKPCPVHHQFKHVRIELKTMLESTSLLSLSNDIHKGITFLK